MPDRQDINSAPLTGEVVARPVEEKTRHDVPFVSLRLRVNGRRYDKQTEEWVTKPSTVPLTVWREDLRVQCLTTLNIGDVVALQYRLGAYQIDGKYGEVDVLTATVDNIVTTVAAPAPRRGRRRAARAEASDAQTQTPPPASTPDDDIPF